MKLKCSLISILREYYWEYETKCLLIWVFGDHLLGVALRVYIIVASQIHFSTFSSIAFFSSQRTCHNLKCKATALNSWDLTLVLCISLKVVHQNIYLWQFHGQKILSRIFALYNNLEISCCMHIVLSQEQSLTKWHDHYDKINSALHFDRRRGKNVLHLWEIINTLVGIFHVYYTCGKLSLTFVENFFISRVGNSITPVGIITVVGNFITVVGVITSGKFYNFVGPTG